MMKESKTELEQNIDKIIESSRKFLIFLLWKLLD